jgi:hypothetical protein
MQRCHRIPEILLLKLVLGVKRKVIGVKVTSHQKKRSNPRPFADNLRDGTTGQAAVKKDVGRSPPRFRAVKKRGDNTSQSKRPNSVLTQTRDVRQKSPA